MKRKTKKEVFERSIDIFKRVVQGEKYTDIAETHNVSVERCRQGFSLICRFISRHSAIERDMYCDSWNISLVRAKKDVWLQALEDALKLEAKRKSEGWSGYGY